MIKGKNIFITGGAGFIANTLIRKLAEDNHIVVYDNFHRDTLTNSGFADHPNVEIIRGDVLDYYLLNRSMKDAEIVVHAAVCAVHIIVDSDKTHTLLREQHFRVKPHLQVVSPQP